MATRLIKDAVDLKTGEKIYLKNHAEATFCSNGQSVESEISSLKNKKTITDIKINGESKGSDGSINLGTFVGGDGTITNIKKVTSLPASPDPKTLYVVIE